MEGQRRCTLNCWTPPLDFRATLTVSIVTGSIYYPIIQLLINLLNSSTTVCEILFLPFLLKHQAWD